MSSNPLQENIKRHLHAQNLSAAELERRTGIPHAVVNILHGRSKNPSIKTAQAIAKELGCTLEDLLGETHLTPTTPPSNPNWQPELYQAVFNAVFAGIQKLNLQPTSEAVSQWLHEVYLYTQGSPDQKIDQRFVTWLLSKH